jgi:hypothetical protein
MDSKRIALQGLRKYISRVQRNVALQGSIAAPMMQILAASKFANLPLAGRLHQRAYGGCSSPYKPCIQVLNQVKLSSPDWVSLDLRKSPPALRDCNCATLPNGSRPRSPAMQPKCNLQRAAATVRQPDTAANPLSLGYCKFIARLISAPNY